MTRQAEDERRRGEWRYGEWAMRRSEARIAPFTASPFRPIAHWPFRPSSHPTICHLSFVIPPAHCFFDIETKSSLL